MDRDTANAARLRINRIALTHRLDTQELIPKLVLAEIISPEDDVEYINQGTSRIDRARRMVDCLLDENTKHIDRPVNWFTAFRNILLKDSDGYTNLVDTLDHTKIPKVNSAQKSSTEVSFDQSIGSSSHDIPINYSRRIQEQVTNIEFDRYAMNKVVLEGNFQRIIDNLDYYTQTPEQLFAQLSNSTHTYDHEQLHYEKQVLEQMRRLELMTNLLQEEKSLANQTIFDTEIMNIVLNDTLHHHYFYKHLHSLSTIFGINYDEIFVKTYKTALLEANDLFQMIDKGFLLYQFLYNYGRYEFCREIIESIVHVITKQINKQQSIIWIYLFRSCCALVQVHNQSLEIKEAWARIEAANEIAENLKATGVGKFHKEIQSK